MASSLAALAWAVPAAGALFQVAENCPSGLGNAVAGGAAVAENACTVWYNPAGMTRLDGEEIILGLHRVSSSLGFEDTGSRVFFAAPLDGGSGGEASRTLAVRNFYYARPLGERLAFGLALNTPFGVNTEYRTGWVGRYHALRSEISSVNFSTTLGYRISDSLSIGLGANLQTLEVELSRAIDFGSMCLAFELAGDLAPRSCAARGLVPQESDGHAAFDADSSGFGFNLGLLWQPIESFRIGLAYRSKISHDLGGSYHVGSIDPPAAAFAAATGVIDSVAHGVVDLPDSESFSVFWRPARRWEVVGDWTRTGWSSLGEIRIRLDAGGPDDVTTLQARDSVRAALGGTFTATVRWKIRFGFAADETASSSARLQMARFPDAARLWYAAGVRYAHSRRLELSLSFATIRADEARIEKLALPNSENFLRGSLRGVYELDGNIMSLGFLWRL